MSGAARVHRALIAYALILATIIGVSVAFFVVPAAEAGTGAPYIINHQGRLMDNAGSLLGGSSGTNYCFRFGIWDNATVGSGTKLWPAGTPSTMTVNVKNGVFNVGIGDTGAGGDSLTYNFHDNDTIFLNVEVATLVGPTCASGDGAESFENLSPRQRIFSSGYAINANTVGGFAPSQAPTANKVPVLDASGYLNLSGTNPQLNASSTNTLTLQGGAGTGDIQFFSSANKITSSGNLTVAGAYQGTKLTATNTTNQLVLGTTNTVTISSTAPAASRTYTIPDFGGAATFVLATPSTTQTQALFASTTSGAPVYRAVVLTDLPTQTGTTNIVLSTSPFITTPRIITSINDTNGATLLGITATGSANNSITLANAANGANPALTVVAGSDSNAGLNLTVKGTGGLVLGSTTANTDTIKVLPQTSGAGAAFNGIVTSADLTGSDKTWTFPNVSGNVVTSGDTGTVTNTMLAGSIAASKLVGTDIATVGIITSGTWTGTTIAVANGGTGNTSYTATNGVIYYDGTKLVGTAASTAAQCLQTAGSGTVPIWGSCGGGSSPFATTTGTISQTTSTDQFNLVMGQAGDYGLKVSTSVEPTVDLVQIDNTNAIAATNSLAALKVTVRTATGAAAESSAINAVINNAPVDASDITNGLRVTGVAQTAASTTQNLLRLVAASSGNTNGTLTGLQIDSITTPNSAAETALNIGTGWDAGLSILSGGNLFKANSANLVQMQNSSGLSILNVNTSSGSGTANLIYNPSFEQNIHNWAAKATPTTGPIWDNTASNAQYGSGTLKFAGDAAGDGVQFNFPFAPSTAYSTSFWAKTASGTATLRLDRQDNGSDVGGCTDSAATTTWTQFTCTFTTGGTINTSTSNIFIKQNAAGTPTVFIDGLTLTLGATPLAYSMPANNLQIDSDYSNITLNAGQKPDIQPWQLNSNALPSGRRGATSVTANGFAYFIGGTTANGSSGAPVTTVNYARINADGSIGAGAWSTTTVLPVALYGHASVVANGYLYVISGCSDSSVTAACTTPVSTVYYSKLNSDGTLGTWQTNASPLPAARGFGAVVFSNGFTYFLGGYNASAQTAVYSGRLNADGAITGWTTTGVTALGAGRYGHTAINANGKIYSIGGCSDAGATCGTAITTVDFATPANDGTLGSWTAATSLPTATGFHSTAILNGHLFNFGGRQAGAPVTSVVYAKINSIGPLGIWTTSSNLLPAARQQSTSLFVNSYIYNIGGFDGTATLPTSIHFASGPRVLVFGGLDLVSLNAQTLTDYAGAGTLTAGNTRVVGDIRIDGFADLNNGLSVDSAINLNAVSAVAGQNIFNINNLNSNSIFSVRHMSTNFGSLATAGAFMQKNSYWGEEFNVSHVTGCNSTALANTTGLISAYARGDTGGNASAATACTSGTSTLATGYLNVSMYIATATIANNQCLISSQNVANGVERISAVIATAVAGSRTACAENIAATTTTSNKILTTTNLPVIAAKVKVQAMTVNATNSIVVVGANIRDNVNTDGAGVNLPNTGIFFTNCSTYTTGVAGGCSNTTWYGMVASGNALVTGAQTCSVGSGSLTAQFSYLRIEVRGTSDIHFYADYNTADGINEVECGTGVTGASSTAAMTPWLEVKALGNNVLTNTLDVDYIRTWQDDNVETASTPFDQTAPLSVDQPAAEQTPFDARVILAHFMALTDEEVAAAQSQQIDTGLLTASLEIVTSRLTTSGLIVDSLSSLDDLIKFQSDIELIGRPYFNSDTAGFALISQGAKTVDIVFDQDYLEQPIVNISITMADDPSLKDETDQDKIDAARQAQDDLAEQLFDKGIQYLVTHTNEHGFTILLNKTAPQDIRFSWTALAVKSAKLFSSKDPTLPDSESSQPTVAGDSTDTPVINDEDNSIQPADSLPDSSGSVEEPPVTDLLTDPAFPDSTSAQ